MQLLVVLRTMTSVLTFLGLLFLFMFAFAILGMNLFGGKLSFPDPKDPDKSIPVRSNFDTFLWAMVTVFQVSSYLLSFLDCEPDGDRQVSVALYWRT